MNNNLKYIIIGGAIAALSLYVFRKPIKKGVVSVIDYGLSKQQEAYIKELNPAIQDSFRKLIAAIGKKGYRVILTSSYRSFAHQHKLYKSKQTPAKAGRSYHNYGLAIDINLVEGTKMWRKADSIKSWEKTGIPKLIRKMGFFWGGDITTGYHDPVHISVNKSKYSINDLQAMAIKRYGKDPDDIKGNQLKLVA